MKTTLIIEITDRIELLYESESENTPYWLTIGETSHVLSEKEIETLSSAIDRATFFANTAQKPEFDYKDVLTTDEDV